MPVHDIKAQEKAAEALFNKYKTAIIQHYGRGPLSSEQLDAYGREAFGAMWGGWGDQRLTLKPGRYYVVNTSYAPKSRGVHWVAVVTSRAGVVHLFDSFARNGSHIMPKLAAGIRKKGGSGGHFTEADRSDAEQRGSSAVCGHSALAFLCVVRDLGVRAALKI
jgi:hypothetical protein